MVINRKKQTLFVCIFTIIILIAFLSIIETNAFASTGVTVNVDGKAVMFTQEPIIKDGRTLVPLRAIFEALGMNVEWDQNTQSVTANKDNVIIKLQINNYNASVGNTKDESITTVLDVAPQIINDRTLVPVRFIGEASGADVFWNQLTKTVDIKSNNDRYFGEMYDDNSNVTHLGYMSRTSLLQDGFGLLIFSNNDIYWGNFVNGIIEGQGTYYWADGSYYTGAFTNGLKNGQGTFYWSDNTIYVGEWANDQRDGYGELYLANGDIYSGQWNNDAVNGLGKYTFTNGIYDQGSFENGIMTYGTRYNSDGTIYYTGKFSNGMPDLTETTNIFDVPDDEIESITTIDADTSITLGYSFPFHLYSYDGKEYLGKLVTNEYDSDSIWNAYGTYGSKYSSDSIWNTYGDYGSEYSTKSAFNKYTTTPPKIVDNNGNFIGYLTTNEYLTNGYSIETLTQFLNNNYQ
jgi:hypothetical protein